MTERYLVPATLTDEQCDTLDEALSEAEGIRDPFDKWLVISRAIGTPVPESGLEAVVSDILRDIAELPDRTSPDDAPDMLLVMPDELEAILRRALTTVPPAAIRSAGDTP